MDTVMYSVQKKEETKNEEGNVQETQRTKPQLKSECSCANIGLHPRGSAYRSALSPSMISSDEQTTEDDLTPRTIQPNPHLTHPILHPPTQCALTCKMIANTTTMSAQRTSECSATDSLAAGKWPCVSAVWTRK